MTLETADRALLAAVAAGLPLVSRPYAAIGEPLGLSEETVLARLERLLAEGVISRLGIVVRHHELGWRANAMTVWDVPDDRVPGAGARLRDLPFVTLCYRRPRRPPAWPYNLFCMIHGQDRDTVLAQVEEATAAAGLGGLARDVLFSARRFKQRGARYAAPEQRC
ncbi:MAG TPA: AsnC family transcriptional regulator [Geminicoccaceae bacterium]|nr:AsnC family transcriptional regulator [Geminicoccus sp.]HMU50651.1 AsnC family transcriptional regulator [Geminicoccaceae bacterium]